MHAPFIIKNTDFRLMTGIKKVTQNNRRLGLYRNMIKGNTNLIQQALSVQIVLFFFGFNKFDRCICRQGQAHTNLKRL
jgi:hypothetical protein